MECPKCGAEIEKSTMVCPNCKKVLKIVCHKCKTINETNICKKCGEVLVTKCTKCGKINLMKNEKCSKCGHPTNINAIEAESNIEVFAVLRIDFPNSDLLQASLGSGKLYQKFKTKIDSAIVKILKGHGLRRQIMDKNVYIIRFNKDYTFNSSLNSAIITTIELATFITKLNIRLLKKRKIYLKCNFSIMKRGVEQNPNDIDTHFHVDLTNVSTNLDQRAVETFQVIADDSFYDYYNEKYKMLPLDTILIDGRVSKFYEIDLKPNIDIETLIKEEQTENSENIEIPKFVQLAVEEQEEKSKEILEKQNSLTDNQIYDIEMINFEEINCRFAKIENINSLDLIVRLLNEIPKGVLALKTSEILKPYTLKLLSAVNDLNIYDNIIPVTCHQNMKYEAYSFFREFISSIFEYATSHKLFNENNFSMFRTIDTNHYLNNLINLEKREMVNTEEIRDEYAQIFYNVLQAIPNTLIYIENFELIDSTSRHIIERLFDYIEDLNIGYVISYDSKFSLHSDDAHYLLSRPYYTELSIVGTPFEQIISNDIDYYSNIMDDFYFRRIAKYDCGSTLYLDMAIQYLVELEVYGYDSDDKLVMITPKTIVIPSGLDKLIQRRLHLLKDNTELIRFITMLSLLGSRVDVKTISTLGFAGWEDLIQQLADMGYLYVYNNCIYFTNYDILRKAVIEVIKEEDLLSVQNDLFQMVFDIDKPTVGKAFLYSYSKNYNEAISEWENLANFNLSLGDVDAYTNCACKILEYLDDCAQLWSEEDLETYKLNLYENISNNLLEYDPDKIKNFSKNMLEKLKHSIDNEKYIVLCIKMIQGSLKKGEYMYARDLVHSIFEQCISFSIDPASENFNLYFLVASIVYIKILFNIGIYSDCIDLGYNILNVLDDTKIQNIEYVGISQDEFRYILSESIGYMALSSVLLLRNDVSDILTLSQTLIPKVPKYAEIEQFQQLLKGDDVSLQNDVSFNDTLSEICYNIVFTFSNYKDDADTFAQSIYKSKLLAREAEFYFFEAFADIMIGYAYIKKGSYRKSEAILNSVIENAKLKGMYSIIHIAWYVLSILRITESKFDLAYGVLNNSNISMSKNNITYEYLMMLNNYNMYKVLTELGNAEQAQICIDQVNSVIKKYNLNNIINIDN